MTSKLKNNKEIIRRLCQMSCDSIAEGNLLKSIRVKVFAHG